MPQLAIIDLRDSAGVNVEKIRAASKQHGAFYLTGHGIPQPLIDQLLAYTRAMFNLPDDLQAQVGCSTTSPKRGLVLSTGGMALDKDHSTAPDTRQFYSYGAEGPKEVNPHFAPNVYPPDHVLPGFRETVDAYYAAARAAGARVVNLLGMSLGLPDGGLYPAVSEGWASMLLNHYPAIEAAPKQGRFAAGAHCDQGLCTLLLPDPVVSGLQIEAGHNGSGVWVDVPPAPPTAAVAAAAADVAGGGSYLIANLGMAAHRMSNGVYRAVRHRVVIDPAGRERVSVPLFIHPNYSFVNAPLLQPEAPVPRFPAVAHGELFDLFHRAIYSGAATPAAATAVAIEAASAAATAQAAQAAAAAHVTACGDGTAGAPLPAERQRKGAMAATAAALAGSSGFAQQAQQQGRRRMLWAGVCAHCDGDEEEGEEEGMDCDSDAGSDGEDDVAAATYDADLAAGAAGMSDDDDDDGMAMRVLPTAGSVSTAAEALMAMTNDLAAAPVLARRPSAGGWCAADNTARHDDGGSPSTVFSTAAWFVQQQRASQRQLAV